MNPNTAPKNSAPYVLSSEGICGTGGAAAAPAAGAFTPARTTSKARGKYMAFGTWSSKLEA